MKVLGKDKCSCGHVQALADGDGFRLVGDLEYFPVSVTFVAFMELEG